MRIVVLALCLSLASTATLANQAKPAAPSASQAADARRKQLEIALADVCARHPAAERCFLVIARDAKGAPGIWFLPIFDGAVDQALLGEAQRAWTRLVPGGGAIPMLLLPKNQWKQQLKGVAAIYVRPAAK